MYVLARSVRRGNTDRADRQPWRLTVRGPGGQAGFTLMEVMIAMALMMVILLATFYSLDSTSRSQERFQSYGEEITTAQAAMSQLVHDLREATEVLFVTPDKIEFQVPLKNTVTGVTTTYTVLYDCTAPDSLGSGYTRCARTQSSSGTPPAAGSTFPPPPTDIQHVYNNASRYSTFCNSTTGQPSGAVFFILNSNISNTDGSTAYCDEAYEWELAGLVNGAEYVQITVDVPASGDQTSFGLAHKTVLETGTFLPNLSAGS
jgi:prepilin-type N-terminal cleavage/methylation domain-containing protein